MEKAVNFLTIHSWNDVLPRVHEAKALLRIAEGEECFYRGHADMNWPLLPTLFRIAGQQKWDDRLLLDKEGAFFWEFQRRAHELHSRPLDDWEYLFAMRHHGVPTRLLDWTDSFAVALYFAVKSKNEHPAARPCIWVLNPYSLNEEATWGRDLVAPLFLGRRKANGDCENYGELLVGGGVHWESPLAIYPKLTTARMRSQRGWFTIHGTDRRPIEEIIPDSVVKIEFDGSSEKEAGDLLDLLGLDEFSIFADLDALGKSLIQKNIP